MEKEQRKKAIKIAAACMLAILVANLLHLRYYTTAGIITILTIQDTKKQTIQTAVRRGLSYISSLLMASILFSWFGYTLWAYGIYIFIFIFLCVKFWPESMTVASVLVSHFLIEQSMSSEWLMNETLLFLIGTCLGIAVNMLLLKQRDQELAMLIHRADDEMKKIIGHMAVQLGDEDSKEYANTCFILLNERLEIARNCAAYNFNNAVFETSTFELDYVEMRQKQSMELEDIYRSVEMIQTLPRQAAFVAEYMGRISREYHRDNDVQELLDGLERILDGMKTEEMPKSREEFEARAVLFYILKQLEEFLKLKNEFVREHQKKYSLQECKKLGYIRK